MSEPKQVIIVRRDLGMSPGKLAAQVAHASVSAVLFGSSLHSMQSPDDYEVYDYRCIDLEDDIHDWLEGSQVKIVLGVDTEAELLGIYNDAQNTSTRRAIIKDEGRTQLQGQNYTAVAIGPAAPEDVDEITGHLKLL